MLWPCPALGLGSPVSASAREKVRGMEARKWPHPASPPASFSRAIHRQPHGKRDGKHCWESGEAPPFPDTIFSALPPSLAESLSLAWYLLEFCPGSVVIAIVAVVWHSP